MRNKKEKTLKGLLVASLSLNLAKKAFLISSMSAMKEKDLDKLTKILEEEQESLKTTKVNFLELLAFSVDKKIQSLNKTFSF